MPKDINSPFTPGRPVPIEFFVGRRDEVNRLRTKVRQSGTGRLEIGFVTGERGIGKSSLASLVRHLCEREHQVLGLHTFLGGITSLEEMVRRIFDGLLKESVGTSVYKKIEKFFGNHVRKVGLFGISVEFGAPERDLRRLAQDFAPALRNLIDSLEGEKSGILLILDDINGLATSAQFANWLKSLVDEVSTSSKPLPLCILVVGLEERRQSLIGLQPSLARVFDLVDIRAWRDKETRSFYDNAFSKAGVRVDKEALRILTRYAGGLPVLAHEIGDAAFLADDDSRIDRHDAIQAVVSAAEVVGRKHLEPQVFSSIRSSRYRGILRKIAREPFGETFTRAEVLEHLSKDETRVLDNFLGKMVELGVLVREPERGRGTYKFGTRLHYVYFAMEAERAQKSGD